MKDSILKQVEDKNRNRLIITTKGRVILKLVKEKRQRKIGMIDRKKKTLIIKRKRAKHLHVKSNSYGFNHHLLSKAKSFDEILLKDEYGEYKFSVRKVLDHGKTFMHYKQQGFELQIFLPLEIIELHRKEQKIETFNFVQ